MALTYFYLTVKHTSAEVIKCSVCHSFLPPSMVIQSETKSWLAFQEAKLISEAQNTSQCFIYTYINKICEIFDTYFL